MLTGIDTMVKKFGRDVSLHLPDGWTSGVYSAFIQPLRHKDKTYLERVHTQIGYIQKGYYLYIGPQVHDLTALSDDAYVLSHGEKFKINEAEKIYLSDSVYYIWAILEKITEGQ